MGISHQVIGIWKIVLDENFLHGNEQSVTAVNDFTLSCLTARRGSIVVSGNRQIFPKKFNARLGIVASTGMVALRTYTAGSAVLTGKGRVILMNFL